jgi:Zn-dependent protease with chaperone function
MNFFRYQHQARRATTRLVLLFVLAVLAIVLAVNLAAYPVLGADLQAQALLSLATALVIGIASWWRVRALRGGGALIAAQMGGRLVPADTSDPLLRRYRNVAEEMAIAAGIPVPLLFVLDDEQGINAFAAGYSPSDAAVAVTRGALLRLNRDELQGVMRTSSRMCSMATCG